MKTLYVSIMAVFIGVTSLHAANMCIQNDASMVVLDPTIGGTANASDATGKTWSTRFSYGIISGIAACYSNVGSTQGVVASDQNMSVYTTGSHCYCKMLRPVQSPWVYSGYSFSADCVSNCATFCATNAAVTVAFRRGLFGSVGRN